MGFRSTFVSEDVYTPWPEWFIKKWNESVYFNENHHGVIASRLESKMYYWEEMAHDIQRAVQWGEVLNKFRLVFFHECGGLTRCEIQKDSIRWNEPDYGAFQEVPCVQHSYCYGCSDIREVA